MEREREERCKWVRGTRYEQAIPCGHMDERKRKRKKKMMNNNKQHSNTN